MKRNILMMICAYALAPCAAQTVQQRLEKAVQLLLKDEQMKHAIMGFEVVETKTGKAVYTLNNQVGLAPASTQKIFSCIAALDMLGRDYRFRTTIGYDSVIEQGVLKGNLYMLILLYKKASVVN